MPDSRFKAIRMTWNTPAGKRVLEGAEAALFTAMVDELHAQLVELQREDFGLSAFEELTLNSRLAMLLQVTEALLCETDQCPTPTAVNEATVATIFEVGQESVDVEIDMSAECEAGRYHWRQLIHAAFDEVLRDQVDIEAIEVRSTDRSEWQLRLDCLSDRILWDADYADGDLFLDSARDDSVSDDEFASGYFTAIAPDPRDAETEIIRKRLRSLCRNV